MSKRRPSATKTEGMGARRRAARQTGLALMTSIWTVAVISAISIAILTQVRAQVMEAVRRDTQLKLEAAADAGVYIAIDKLLHFKRTNRKPDFPLNGAPVSADFNGAALRLSVQDAGGRVDLNTARPEVLTALFEALGAGHVEAIRLSDQILDARDPDRRPTGSGGEYPAYQAAGLNYGPKNGPFASVGEVAQIPAFRAAWLPLLDRHVTVFSGLTGIDPRMARPGLLALLTGDEAASPASLAQSPGRRFFTTSSARTFIIDAQASIGRDIYVRRAVVTLNPAGAPPYDVLEWSRGPSLAAQTSAP